MDRTRSVPRRAGPAARRPARIRIVRPDVERLAPTWRQAAPERIAAALAAAQRRPAGAWYVVGPAATVPARRSIVRTVAGREVVLWRSVDGPVHAGPGACPHLGAVLDGCPVHGSTLRCRWHGRAFTPHGASDWPTYPAYDDGVLVWVQVPGAEAARGAVPALPERPPLDRSVTAVVSLQGRCEPEDVIANRLDPWHGSWLHPYAFTHLRVDDAASTVDCLAVDVTFRLGPRLGVPVRATFSCPDARTIVMRIVDGEGAGSVVETHATPLGTDEHDGPITQVTEATLAYSARPGFGAAVRMARLLRPAIRRSARRLWADDLAYAERSFRVRTGEVR